HCSLPMIATWNVEGVGRAYCMLFRILETGMIGTFLALDFFLFYIFWEIMLLPMYFLIGVWGGPRREYAAIKFFLYTLLGSVFILVGILGFYFTDIQDFVHPSLLPAEKPQASVFGGTHPPPAPPPPSVNSFDLMALPKVGRAAFLKLAGREDEIEVMDIKDGQPVVKDGALQMIRLGDVKDTARR